MAQYTINNRMAVDRAGAAELADIAVSNVDLLYRNRATSGFPERVPGTTYWYADDIRAFRSELARRKQDALTKVSRHGDPEELITPPEIARVVGYRNVTALRNSPIYQQLMEIEHVQTQLGGGRVRREWPRKTVWEVADRRVGKGSGAGRPIGTPRGGVVDLSGDADDIVDADEAARILGYSHRDKLPFELTERAEPRAKGGPRRFRRSTVRSFADEFGLTTSPTSQTPQ